MVLRLKTRKSRSLPGLQRTEKTFITIPIQTKPRSAEMLSGVLRSGGHTFPSPPHSPSPQPKLGPRCRQPSRGKLDPHPGLRQDHGIGGDDGREGTITDVKGAPDHAARTTPRVTLHLLPNAGARRPRSEPAQAKAQSQQVRKKPPYQKPPLPSQMQTGPGRAVPQ